MLAAMLLSTVLVPSPWEIVVLGVAQDAGIPHLGCDKGVCAAIRSGKAKPERVSCLGLINRKTGENYLFDATPDIRSQLTTLNGGKQPNAVFLTHAHMGHYSGLLYFGRESVDWKGVKVVGSPKMGEFLRSNDPWKMLMMRNLNFIEIRPGQPSGLQGVQVTQFTVPHRDEFTDTYGYRIEGPEKTVVFIPDIDRWEKWDQDIKQIANEVDLLFLDGTFSSPEEIGARDITQIPHPMIPATRELLKGSKGKVWFIHLNHTNPALSRDKDVAKDGMKFRI